jgi:transposase
LMSESREDGTLRFQRLEAQLQELRAAYAALQAEHRTLQGACNKLQTQNEKLLAENAELRGGLATSERAGKRQAAPFSRNKPKKVRKKNGRKAGEQHGDHGHRPLPNEADVDEQHLVPLPCQCPDCGCTEFNDVATVEQFQEELPQQPLIRKFTIHRGTCRGCGRRVQGRHPLQTSDATGACASQLGPVAQAAIVYLNKHAGMSYRKISDAFEKLDRIRISPGGCAQIVLRAADRLEPALVEIHEKIRASEHITPDETGWRLGGRPVWLHAAVGDDGATCYTIDPQRDAGRLEALIGINWSGTMTHDGFSTYDRFAEASHQQCVDHALRRARGLLEKHPENAEFPRRVIEIFTEALALRDRHLEGAISASALYEAHEEYVSQLLAVTAKRYRTEEYRTFAKHLYRHGEQWLLFLIDPTIPATNHRAEQALKTPITNRKVFGGNQEPAGARAQETTSSVLQTCKNQALDFVSYVSTALCGCVASLFG